MNKKSTDKLKAYQALINKEIESLKSNSPSRLAEAQKYSLTAGGKRIRPVVTLAVCEAFGGEVKAALPYALAVEMIHTASLIHDDLPVIDNDDLRRGKPTCHVAFGEPTALLAADGLFMDAFGIVASNPHVKGDQTAEAVKLLSLATGSSGLVGGEFLDVMGEGRELSEEELGAIHRAKTGALVRVAAQLGAIAAGATPDDERMLAAVTYAESIGLAFQIVDDVLDVTGTAEALGKTPGKDERSSKATYLSFYSVEEALALADDLTSSAVSAIAPYDATGFLTDLASDLVARKS